MLITKEQISINQQFATAKESIVYSGKKMVELGFIKDDYIELMLKRQETVSVYIGNFVALPHGEAKEELILKEGIFVTQVPDGVDFGVGEERQIATLIFSVALYKESQLSVLQELAFFCSDMENIRKLSDTTSIDEFLEILNNKLFY